MPSTSKGVWIIPLAFVVLALCCAGSVATAGSGELGLRSAIRATAKVGAVWFALVFSASAVHSLLRSRQSKWLMRNRRHFGVGFAVLHFGHLAVVLLLAFQYTDSFLKTTAVTSIVGGGIGYLWLLAMTITSFKGPAKALGRRGWKALHKSGVYVLWGIFLLSYLPMFSRGPLYSILVVVLSASYLLRLLANLRQRRRGKRITP
jgi:sulfoxide reductase heme-binding subunit YedZ